MIKLKDILTEQEVTSKDIHAGIIGSIMWLEDNDKSLFSKEKDNYWTLSLYHQFKRDGKEWPYPPLTPEQKKIQKGIINTLTAAPTQTKKDLIWQGEKLKTLDGQTGIAYVDQAK